jgi:hypothetical protein
MDNKIRLIMYILMIIFDSIQLQTWLLTGGAPSIGRLLLQTLFLIYFIYLAVNIVLGE